jgi:tetratricopeptide (TPR) repeat protein
MGGESWKTWIGALGTLSVTSLAIVIPSIQDHWVLMQQRRALDASRAVAATLLSQSKFQEAEETLAHAIALNAGPQLELERERLVAKTAQVNADLQWSAQLGAALEESDFALLEAMQARAGDLQARAWTLNNHAVFVANRGDSERALPLVEQAVAQAPQDARIHVTLGNVRWDLDQLEPATAAYLAALARDPDNVAAHFNLALVYETQGKTNAAIDELQRVIELHPDAAAREQLARLERQRGERS